MPLPTYGVSLKKSAENELRLIPVPTLAKVMDRIQGLSHQPRPQGVEKMAGGDLYRIRQGDWRVLYSIDDQVKTVFVIKIGNRRDVYRR